MATIINNPPETRPVEDSGVGVVVGLIVAVILLILFFMFAWPAIRSNETETSTPIDTGGSANINVTVPSSPSGAVSSPSGY